MKRGAGPTVEALGGNWRFSLQAASSGVLCAPRGTLRATLAENGSVQMYSN